MTREHVVMLERKARRRLVDAFAALDEAGHRDLAARCRALLRRLDLTSTRDDEVDDGPTEPFVHGASSTLTPTAR